MSLSNTQFLWIIWLASSLLIAAYFVNILFFEEDKHTFMPGPLTDGHYQFSEKCNVCHTDAFGGQKDTAEVLQTACLKCHGDDRKKPQDSHPLAKFKDPRNADRLKKIDALKCVTCHTEHREEITLENGLTQPLDVCFYCHSDIAKDRPTHKDMSFNSCKDSGCHNYHDNRALYTKFLVKHENEPETLTPARLPDREFAKLLDEDAGYPRNEYPIKKLTIEDEDAPGDIKVSENTRHDWKETAHASSGVNCTACHMIQGSASDGGNKQWSNTPDTKSCKKCHGLEVKRYGNGKHGMRLASGLPPMKPGMARSPMVEKAGHKELGCNSCHPGHRYDIKHAAVDACLECHNDEHSIAYKKSRHYELWKAELKGEAEPNTGVSCATCHMPRITFDVSEWSSRIMVDHNQNANLSPNSKMIRSSCLYCHGLGFSIDSLADKKLTTNNFRGRPSIHVDSIQMAVDDTERRKKKRGTDDDSDMFGF